MDATPNDELLHDVVDGVATVVFNRPESRNALTFEMYEGLARVCREMPTDGSVRALVVSGAGGRAFAAGTDMTQFRGFATERDCLDYEHRMDAILDAVERCPVPTIAAITGACTGGGAAIAACCDLRVADERLKFGFPIARTLGNCLSVANLARLSALIGQARVREIIFTARLIEAAEAERIGLVARVMPEPEGVMAEARRLAATLSAHAPLTLRATKEGLRRALRDGPGAPDEDLVTLCYMSEDFREGIEAFLSKRPPVWKGR